MITARSPPTDEELEELLLSCRYGDLDDIKQFIERFGAQCLSIARDDNGNTGLHMAAANGHEGMYTRVNSFMGI